MKKDKAFAMIKSKILELMKTEGVGCPSLISNQTSGALSSSGTAKDIRSRKDPKHLSLCSVR